MMQSVSMETAKALVSSNTVTKAIVQCFDGRRWAIVLRGRDEYVLKSARQNPRAFAKIETALSEIQMLGLRHAEVDFVKWNRDQGTLPAEAA
jgi:hypothetical protein